LRGSLSQIVEDVEVSLALNLFADTALLKEVCVMRENTSEKINEIKNWEGPYSW